MIVYVVTTGSYSDYCINAIFSREKLALEYKKRYEEDKYGNNIDIDKWEVDAPIPEIGLEVHMDKEGNVLSCEKRFGENPGFRWFAVATNYSVEHFSWIVQTEDPLRAVKVANEKRAIILANNTWGEYNKTKELFKDNNNEN